MTKELNDYSFSTDASAADPRIDALRAKIYCVEEKHFSKEYHDPSKRSIGNAYWLWWMIGRLSMKLKLGIPLDIKDAAPKGHLY